MRFMLVLLFVSTVAAAAPRKVALMPITGGESVPDKAAGMLTEAVAAELRRLPEMQLTTQAEIAAILSHEQQKQLFGCTDDACAADLAGSLGVDELVAGSIGRLGESWLVHLKRIDVKKAATVKQADKRIRGGTVDDVLDALPALVGELYEGVATGIPTATIAKPAPTAEVKIPPATREQVLTLDPAVKARLVLLTDGKGYVAYDPEQGSFDPFFAGDATHLWAQRVSGGGSDGSGNFDRVIWEPRVKARWQGGFVKKDGQLALQCGDRKIDLKPVPAKEAKELLAKATFYEPRWNRRAFAIARDDSGTWFYVDQLREPEDNSDFRFFVGSKGKLAYRTLDDAIVDESGLLFVTPQGRLKIQPSERKAEWIVGASRTPLTYYDIEDQANFAYTQLGVYKGENLGTACDGRF